MTIDPIAVWSSFLASPQAPKTAMSPLELDGYLTGVVVTPQAAPILPSVWMARLWGDDEPIFGDDTQINAVLGAVVAHYNLLIRDIDRSLKRMEAGPHDRLSAPVRRGRRKVGPRRRARLGARGLGR